MHFYNNSGRLPLLKLLNRCHVSESRPEYEEKLHKRLMLNKLIKSDFKGSVMH